MTSQREQMENPADSDEELEMKYKHIPTAYDALRKVPQNPMFIQVCFDCLFTTFYCNIVNFFLILNTSLFQK